MINKKSQSQVVATVLLILIVVISVMVVMAFVVPFVRDALKNDCYKVSGQIEFRNSPIYTCWNSTNKSVNVQIHLGDLGNTSIKGFQVNLGKDDGSTDSYEIYPETPDDVTMYGGASTIKLPTKNGERTYTLGNESITSKPTKLELSPILPGDKRCGTESVITPVPECEILS